MTQSVKHEFLGLDRFGLVSPPYPVLETIRNRTAAMRAAYSGEKQFHAFDWAVSALTLTQGVHLRSRSIVLHRQGAERGKYSSEHLRSAPGWLDRLFPFAQMSAALLPRLTPSQLLLAIPALLLLNARQSAEFLLAYARRIAHR